LNLKEKLSLLPEKSGVYLLKDQKGKVLYVGKALSLKKRVPSYFQKTFLSPRLTSLITRIGDVEWIVTQSESEAFLLEYNLIKQYHPHYNIQFRDDKSYPFIKLTIKESFPRVFLTRNPQKDGSLYFGPYTNVRAAKKSLQLVHHFFPLRRCQGKFKYRVRPCLHYHIKECSAPCVGAIDQEKYSLLVDSVLLFLRGHYQSLLFSLEKRMVQASREEKFEEAVKLRDSIWAIQRMNQSQRVASFLGGDRDLISLATVGKETCAVVFMVREGRLIGKNHFFIRINKGTREEEIIVSFLKQYYLRNFFIPSEILIPTAVEEIGEIASWLSEKRGKKIEIKVPRRGEKLRLMKLARENAALIFYQYRAQGKEEALSGLKSYLSLGKIPQRIEGFDISNIRGEEAVGSMVVFEEGKARKSEYRKFKIKTVKGIDDFAMLAEVVDRRYRRQLRGKKSLPDLILVDGGKGQVSTCWRVLQKLGLDCIPLVGLAKEFEEVYVPFKRLSLDIPRDSAALKLLQEIRDEAHRFAYSYHRSRREKKIRVSSLEEIPGIGEMTKQLLLSHYKSLEYLRKSPPQELQKIAGIGPVKAKTIHRYLSEGSKKNQGVLSQRR